MSVAAVLVGDETEIVIGILGIMFTTVGIVSFFYTMYKNNNQGIVNQHIELTNMTNNNVTEQTQPLINENNN